MTVEELKEKGGIYISNIEDGFLNYPYYMLEGTRAEVYNKVKALIEEEGYNHCYVDFYYGNLNDKEKAYVEERLSKEEISYIQSIIRKDVLFYPLNETLLEITLKLSLDEILFSTYYCCKSPITIWGNYNFTFPVFHL